MIKINSRMVAVILALLISGCGSVGNLYTYKAGGMIYAHKVEPYTHHHRPLPTAQTDKTAAGDRKELTIQSVTVAWDENAIGEIAKKAGIQTIHYADLETWSIFFGTWTQYFIHIYGTAEGPPGSPPVPVTKTKHITGNCRGS